jgi:hypothetical protein
MALRQAPAARCQLRMTGGSSLRLRSKALGLGHRGAIVQKSIAQLCVFRANHDAQARRSRPRRNGGIIAN